MEDRIIVGGLLTSGILPLGANLLLGPFDDCTFVNVTVESIHRNKVPCKVGTWEIKSIQEQLIE